MWYWIVNKRVYVKVRNNSYFSIFTNNTGDFKSLIALFSGKLFVLMSHKITDKFISDVPCLVIKSTLARFAIENKILNIDTLPLL